MIDPDMNFNSDCLLNLPEDQKIAFLRAFSKMACEDGHFDECEKDFIRNVAANYGIDEDKAEKAMQSLDEKEIVAEVAKITNRRAALELIKEMCVLAHADDNMSDEETLFIGTIGLAMGIDLDKIEEISNWVIDHLIWLDKGKIIFEEV